MFPKSHILLYVYALYGHKKRRHNRYIKEISTVIFLSVGNV